MRTLRVGWILVGDDFRFGHDRVGDLALLREKAATYSVEAMPTVAIDGERASSTAVRSALALGNVERTRRSCSAGLTSSPATSRTATSAAAIWVFPPPTSCCATSRRCQASFAVSVHGLGDEALAGVASLGVRPTVKQGAKPLLEIFVVRFRRSVSTAAGLRSNFCTSSATRNATPDLDQLTRQIRVDVAQARDYFATMK